MKMEYTKASKYPNLEEVYSQCSGPGGLKLAEFIAEKLMLQSGTRLLDIGTNRGLQTCFLAKEYGVIAVGIDPGQVNVRCLADNALSWGVQNQIFALRAGVPDTGFAANSFDVCYSTTTFEMIRGLQGEDAYRQCLAEVFRILRPEGLLGLGEPTHLDVEIPSDLAPIYTQGKGDGVEGWGQCFATVQETVDAFRATGFEVIQAGYAPDAWRWWEEYCQYDPDCRSNPDDEAKVIRLDAGRWISFGYVIAKKPKEPTKR
jgi:cyclopropane fatty-acyl-phospholipid synthase-like methyltransferase